jgi:hypothetical protein
MLYTMGELGMNGLVCSTTPNSSHQTIYSGAVIGNGGQEQSGYCLTFPPNQSPIFPAADSPAFEIIPTGIGSSTFWTLGACRKLRISESRVPSDQEAGFSPSLASILSLSFFHQKKGGWD